MRLAADLNGTADDAIVWLMTRPTLRLDLTAPQLERWTAAAEACGMRTDLFAIGRVEAALQYTADPAALLNIQNTLTRISADLRALKDSTTP